MATDITEHDLILHADDGRGLAARLHAPVTPRRLHPADVGGKAVGHFGFFRPEHADTLWPEVLQWFDDALAGRPSRASRFTRPAAGLRRRAPRGRGRRRACRGGA